MKFTKVFLPLFTLILLGLLTLSSCGESSAQNSNSKYMCPMECEGSNLEEAGQCPGCGMDLVLREAETDGHAHGEGGHDHGDGHTHDHGDSDAHDHGDGEAHDHGEGEAHDHGEGHDHSHGEEGHDHSH